MTLTSESSDFDTSELLKIVAKKVNSGVPGTPPAAS